jgi:CBS domain-containing protein
MLIKSVHDVVAGRTMPSIEAGATIRAACEVLDHHNVGAVVVVKHGALAGILSERDVVRKCVLQGLDPASALVDAIMTADPRTVGAEQGLSDAIAILEAGGFRHLPVLLAGRPVGLLSIRDVPVEYRMLWERFREMRAGQD